MGERVPTIAGVAGSFDPLSDAPITGKSKHEKLQNTKILFANERLARIDRGRFFDRRLDFTSSIFSYKKKSVTQLA